jgi:hypothetical protein
MKSRLFRRPRCLCVMIRIPIPGLLAWRLSQPGPVGSQSLPKRLVDLLTIPFRPAFAQLQCREILVGPLDGTPSLLRADPYSMIRPPLSKRRSQIASGTEGRQVDHATSPRVCHSRRGRHTGSAGPDWLFGGRGRASLRRRIGAGSGGNWRRSSAIPGESRVSGPQAQGTQPARVCPIASTGGAASAIWIREVVS